MSGRREQLAIAWSARRERGAAIGRRRTIRPETGAFVGVHVPLAPAQALAALGRLRELCAPAKLAIDPHGAGALVAEVGAGAPRGVAEALVGDALDAALDWLAGDAAGARARGPTIDAETLAAALAGAAGDWEWAAEPDAGYRLASPLDGGARLHVRAIGDTVRVSTQTALAVPDGSAPRALALFALETNWRLRLARMSAHAEAEARVVLCWDAVLASGLALDRGLAELLTAVAAARAETRRAVAALADPAVAEAYLRGREDLASA